MGYDGYQWRDIPDLPGEARWALPLSPADPEKVTGPKVGTIVRYNDPKYPRWHGHLMRVEAQWYHWSPEVVNRDADGKPVNRGYIRYDWTVVEWPELSRDGSIRWSRMVVDDDKLEAL